MGSLSSIQSDFLLSPAGHYKECSFKVFLHWLNILDPEATAIFSLQSIGNVHSYSFTQWAFEWDQQ